VNHEQRLLEAAALIETVKVTGGRGNLTAGLLKDVVIAKGESVRTGEKVPDLLLLVQTLLAWTQDCGFPGYVQCCAAQQGAPAPPE
jgi:hypothetical protein